MKIFVARLSYDTTEEGLRAAFDAFGDVDEVKIIMDRETERSKGYGFVEMPNDEEAVKAIASLNDTELDGRSIEVKQSVPQNRDRDRRGGGGGGERRFRPRRNSGGGGYSDRDSRGGGDRPRRY